MSDKNKSTSSFDIDSREAIKNVGKLTSNSSSFKKTIDKDYFFEIVNIDPKSCSKNLMQDIDQADLSYRFLTNDETEKLCNDIKIIIETGKLSKSGPKKHKIWEKGCNRIVKVLPKGFYSFFFMVPRPRFLD